MIAELVIGAGRKQYDRPVVTLDLADADVIHDLTVAPWPFADSSVAKITAEHVVEHVVGPPGDVVSFFRFWSEAWRILKPKGIFAGVVPSLLSPHLWSDPGHCRPIVVDSFTFLNQAAYQNCVGSTPMTDYRATWHGDFELIRHADDGRELRFELKAVKPSRISL